MIPPKDTWLKEKKLLMLYGVDWTVHVNVGPTYSG